MDTGKIQFQSYPPEVSYSGNQPDPETDLMDYFSDSPLFSPSCHLDLLRLSSESDDSLKIHSHVCPSMLGLAAANDDACKRDGQVQKHQVKVSFDSSSKLGSKFLFEMEIINRKEETSKMSHGNSLNPHSNDSNLYQPKEKLTSKERNSGKDPRAARRYFVSEDKEKSDSESAATCENTVPMVSSHFLIPSSSHLALRRKLKRQASRTTPAESRERNENMSCPMSFNSPGKSPPQTASKTNHSAHVSKNPRSALTKGSHVGDFKSPGVSGPSTGKTHMSSASAGEFPKLKLPALTDSQAKTSTRERHEETFEERNRKATVPLLPKLNQPNRSSCPVFQKSPKKSSIFAACNSSQSKHASHCPSKTKVKHSC